MAAQAFTNLGGNQNGNSNEPTSFVAADGFVGAPTTPFNPNSPTFGQVTFPAGTAAGQVLHGVLQTASFPLAALAQTNTDLTETLPAGAIIRTMAVYTTTAFTGNSGSVTIAVGSAAAGAQYVAATNIAAIGIVSLTLVAAQAASFLSFPSGSPNLFIRLAQASAASATGAATLTVGYVIP